MTSIATILSGGEGVGIGARAAGLDHLWGVEIDDKIARVARINGFNMITADIRDISPWILEPPDVLHASPECQNASSAKQVRGAETFEEKETQLDMDIAWDIMRYVEILQPRFFTLENVYGYRRFKSFEMILRALNHLDYFTDFGNLNAADFGGLIPCPIHDIVFQNALASGVANDYQHGIAPDIVAIFAMMQSADQAKRLARIAMAHLVRATRLDIAAVATWQKSVSAAYAARLIMRGRADDTSMNAVMSKYGSMDDIDGNIVWLLKRGLDAPLIQERWSIISMETRQITIQIILKCLLATANIPPTITHNGEMMIDCPLCRYGAVPQTRRRLILRAVRGGLVPMLPPPEPWMGWYEAIEDLIPTLPESKFAPWQLKRLSLADSTLVDSAGYVDAERRLPVQRDASKPANTVIANHAQRPMRAFLVDGQNAGRENVTIRQADEPTMTVVDASKAFPKAFIVGGQFGKPHDGSGEPRPPQTRDEGEPVFTVTAQNKGDWRAWLSRGRVVKMTPRALARFQSFPDDYILPDSNRLACKVIGNAVPPLMYQKIVEGLLR